jgi:hypothetical protein
MALLLQPYELPLVSNDLSASETLRDIIYSLDFLSSTVDDIFNRLEMKVTEERNRLTNLKKCVAVCQIKVQKVRGSKKTTTVFSTPRFPGTKTFPLYLTLYRESKVMEVSKFEYSY